MKVKTDILKLSKVLHTWTGITSGIFLFICFIAGGLSVFQNQLTHWATPPTTYSKNIDIDQYNSLVEHVQKKIPVTQEQFNLNFSFNLPNSPPMTWSIYEGKDKLSSGFATIEKQEIIISQEQSIRLGHLIEVLHETAGIPGFIGDEKAGVLLMGGISFLYFIALLSGIILHLPTLVKDYFAIRETKNQKRFWLDMHNVVGITNLPFHIVISITVIVFAFHDLFYTSLSKITGEPVFKKEPVHLNYIEKTVLDIPSILRKVQEIAPDYRVDYMQFNQLHHPEQASVRIAIYSSEHMLRGANHSFLMMNPYSQKFTATDVLKKDKSGLEQFVQSMFSLHFGNFGGVWIRWIYFCLGIGGAFLFYSGNVLWIKSRAKKNTFNVLILKKLTTGTMLGAVLGITLTMAVLKWIYISGLSVLDFNTYFIYSYYIIFGFSILYAFIEKNNDRAINYFIYSIALSLISIPFTSMIAFICPTLGLWTHMSTLSIDLTASALSILFFKLYKKRSG